MAVTEFKRIITADIPTCPVAADAEGDQIGLRLASTDEFWNPHRTIALQGVAILKDVEVLDPLVRMFLNLLQEWADHGWEGTVNVWDEIGLQWILLW
jgi:hypothetical protein